MPSKSSLFIAILLKPIVKKAFKVQETLNYVPSPIPFEYDVAYAAIANQSGRMQYYRLTRKGGRIRIGRNEFIKAYNNQHIVALRPLPAGNKPVFQLQFYVKL